jgi:NDP-sugar pyrophosphorylase family protein
MAELPPVFVLAAGLGTRLGYHTAKTLYPVAGRPVLDWILAECESQGARQVTVTVLRRHLEALQDFLTARRGIDVAVCVDETPQGTLGSLRRAWSARPSARFLVWLGDIVGRPPLAALACAAREAPAVLLAHRRADYENSGVITAGRPAGPERARPLVAFREKPGRLDLRTARVWAGVAAVDAGVLSDAGPLSDAGALPGAGADLGRDLWPRLAGEGGARVLDNDTSRPLAAVDRPRDGAVLTGRLRGRGNR